MIKVNVDEYKALSDFLERSKGKPLKIGMHCHSVIFYNTFRNWNIKMDDFGITLWNDDQSYEFLNEGAYEGYETDSKMMSVFPESGNFEINAEHCVVCFEVLN